MITTHSTEEENKKNADFFRRDCLPVRAILLDIEIIKASELSGRAICCGRKAVGSVM